MVLAHRHSLAFKVEEYPSCIVRICAACTVRYCLQRENHHAITIIAVKKRYVRRCLGLCRKSRTVFAAQNSAFPRGPRCSIDLNALPRVLGVGGSPFLISTSSLSVCVPIPHVLPFLSSPGRRGSPSAPQRSVWCFLPDGSRRGVRPGWPASTWRRRCRFVPGGRRCCRRRYG